MFAKSARGLLDGLAAALCLWVASYQTPLGALSRMAVGKLLRVRITTRPLLAYYSAGVYEAAESGKPDQVLPPLPEGHGPVPPSQALAYGVRAALASSDASTQEAVKVMALARGIPAEDLASAKAAPLALAQLLDGLTTELGSPEAAVAAVFWGEETARFARDRAKAEGRVIGLESMARTLPPGSAERVAMASRALMFGEAFALAWPVPEGTRITSPFGLRTHPILGTSQLHTGVDLSVPSGTLVHATAAGVVRRASEDAINGRVVIIDHGRGVTTAYCHNSALRVAAGDHIEAGQVIAESGTTGRSTGPHVHYQLEFGGKPVDPLAFRMLDAKAQSSSALAND